MLENSFLIFEILFSVDVLFCIFFHQTFIITHYMQTCILTYIYMYVKLDTIIIIIIIIIIIMMMMMMIIIIISHLAPYRKL